MLNNLGVTLTRVGEWNSAEERLRESLRIMDRLNAAGHALLPLENLTELYYTKEDWQALRDHCTLLLDRAAKTGYWTYEVIAHARAGLALLYQGDIDGAGAAESAARSMLADHPGWFDDSVYCDLLSAELAAVKGDHERGLQLLENAEMQLQSRDLYVWAVLRLARGRIATRSNSTIATGLIKDAFAQFEGMGAVPMRQRAEQLLATLGETA